MAKDDLGANSADDRRARAERRLAATGADPESLPLAEGTRRLSEFKYRELFNNIRSAVAIYQVVGEGEDFVFLDVNRALEHIEQLKREDIVGRKVSEVFPGVKDFGLFGVFQRVWRTGMPELFPVTRYQDQRISGWRDNYVYRLPSGEVVAVYDDITEEKQAEEAIRSREAQLRSIFRAAPIGIGMSVNRVIMEVNDQLCSLTGYTRKELLGQSARMFYPCDDDYEAGRRQLYGHIQETGLSTLETRWRRKDGGIIEVLLRSSLLAPDDPDSGVTFTVLDITAHKQAEHNLRLEKRFSDMAIESLPGLFYLFDDQGNLRRWNRNFEEVSGYPAADLAGMKPQDFFLDQEKLQVQAAVQEVWLKGESSVEADFIAKDGRQTPYFFSGKRAVLGEKPCLLGMGIDITARVKADWELRQARQEWEEIFQAICHPTIILDAQHRIIMGNRSALAAAGASAVELEGKKCYEIFHGTDRPPEGCPLEKMFISGRPETVEMEIEALGGVFLVSCTPVLDEAGQVQKVIHIATEITARKQAEEAFQSLIANAPMGIYIVQGKKFVLVNPGFEAITGYRGQELLGQNYLTLVTPEYQPIVRKKAIKALKKDATSPYENQFISKSGETGWVMETVIPIQYQGKRAVMGYFMDITAHKKLENQFLQAQRMEAVGRLAGGLAHDFNNVLAIIVIYVETVLKEIHQGDPLYPKVKGIKEAALRAISLTRQLMAVGRRQVLQPRAVNLNALVNDMEAMLRRLIGEDVELVLTYDPVETVAKVDPSQIEQVLLNLVVNARDAMPQGGRLTIAVINTFLDKSDVSQHVDVAPGPYVMLEVIDTGIGMDRETQAHILEPFYTTKPSSEGSGLGLSTVYGIVKQSDGFMEVDSEPFKGATFKVFLPAATEALEPPARITESPLLQGSETILLVEDVNDLRQLVHDVLQNYGYTVLTASHGKEALLVAEEHQGPIHLLLLDVVLPQMSGGELAERLKSWYPGAKVLCMSGYPEDAIIHRKMLDGSVAFIQKPFSPINLANKVREVLNSSPKV